MNGISKTGRIRLALITTMLLISAFLMLGSERAMTQSSLWTTATDPNNIYNTNTGNVGIGTQTPENLLHVKGDNKYPIFERYKSTGTVVGFQGAAQFGITGPAGSILVGAGPSMLFFSTDSAGDREYIGRVSAVWENTTNGAEAAGIVLNVRTPGDFTAQTEGMRVTSAGNVGIGTSTPLTRLHIVGDVTVTGNIAAKYQDVAEWVPARGHLQAGSVVVLDPSQSNLVKACSQAYDTRVAGVVSEKPGLLLGEAGEGKVMVATTGRVRVKVDATSAPIQVGDILVTSDREGVAMKSQPVKVGGAEIHRPGTIIGKALEPLARGRGEILVLLSLQ